MGLLIDHSGYSVCTHQVQQIRQRGRHPSTNGIVKRAKIWFTGLLCMHSSNTTNQTVRSALIDQSDHYVCAHRPIRLLYVQSSTNQIAMCAVTDQSVHYVCSHRTIRSLSVKSLIYQIVKHAPTNQPVNLLSVHSWSSQIVEKATIDQSESKVCVHPPIRLNGSRTFVTIRLLTTTLTFFTIFRFWNRLLMILNKPLPTVYEASNRNRTQRGPRDGKRSIYTLG